MCALLTVEINNPVSPVRRFLDERFTVGLRAVQSRYIDTVPSLAVTAAPVGVKPGVLDAAAQWLLRFLLDAQPDLTCAVRGARLCARVGVDILPALEDLAERLAVPLPGSGGPVRVFPGPAAGTGAEPELLARACWAVAMLTEVSRQALFVPSSRPRVRVGCPLPTGDDLLARVPPAAVDRLCALRGVFEQTLIPHLGQRKGPWTLGATFTGGRQLKADADVIAAGLLLNVTIGATAPELGAHEVYRLVACALLDVDDTRRLRSLGHFNARYRHLVTWELDALLAELAGETVHLPTLRAQFRTLLLSTRSADRRPRPTPPPGRPPKATRPSKPTRP